MQCLHCLVLFAFVLNGDGAEPPKSCEEFLKLSEDARKQDINKMFQGKCAEDCPVADDLVCPRQDVTFWLYTRNRRDNPIQLDAQYPAPNSGFVKGAPLKILIHGYTKDKDKAINKVLRPAYFSRSEFNIISVDWSPLVRDKCYIQGARSVPTVGHCVALFISRVLEVHGDQFTSVQLLGHSMGAHVSAWASTELDLPRLTEFDPALPLFTNHDILLKKGKARVVDVWHSNGDIYGRDSSDGTVDIFFNDEMDQPGCHCDTSCSHLRAVEYYAETVSRSEPLSAFPCVDGWEGYREDKCPVPDPEDLAEFGEVCTPGRTGTYLAFTNPRSPYILPGRYYLNKETFKSFEKTHDVDCPKHDFISFFADLFNL